MHTSRNHSLLAATALMAFAGVTSASAATLSVGPGKTYAKACAAIADHDSGHLGLRLLYDAVADLGGRLAVSTSPEGGTVLAGSFPTAMVTAS